MTRNFLFAEWIFEILKLHFLWVVYLFRGWIVTGIFPATAAMYAVVRHWIMKKESQPISKLYKTYYQENFKVSNLLGWMFLIVTCIIAVNFLYIPYYAEGLRMVMYPVVIFFAILLLIVWIYLFPAIVHYNLPVSGYFAVILKTGLTSLSGIIMQVFILGIYLLVGYIIPAILVAFGIMPLVLVLMTISYNVFTK